MPFLCFDEGTAAMDVTPVENLFITEYMLHAPGDYVKLYLYLLMHCYHPNAALTLSMAARDVQMTEEEAEKAMKYWEGQGLARRTGDNPPAYVLRAPRTLAFEKQKNVPQGSSHFTEEVYRILGDTPLGYPDLQKIYDWVDLMDLPEEIVLMLLQNEMEENGKFYMPVADRHAREWAQQQVRTVEDVERVLRLDKKQRRELRLLLQRLGHMRNPSEDEKDLYFKWTREWKFTAGAIQEACRATVAGSPTMAYLDGILLRLHNDGAHDLKEVRAALDRGRGSRDFARQILQGLGRTGVSPTDEELALLTAWQEKGYDAEYILLAARASHRRIGGESFEAVDQQLQSWQEKGLTDAEKVRQSALQIREQNEFLRKLYAQAGTDRARPSEQDRQKLAAWEAAGFTRPLLLQAAEYASESPGRAQALPAILKAWQEKGIFTPEAARAEHESHKRGPATGVAQAQSTDFTRHTKEERAASIGAALVDLEGEA